MMKQKYKFIGLVTAVFLLFSQLCFSSEVQPLDGIAAIVNKGIITDSQLDAHVALVKKSLEGKNTPLPPESIFRQQVLQQIINQTLQLQLAKQTGIQVDDEELNKAIESLAKHDNKTLEQFTQSMSNMPGGFERFRQEIKKELIMHKLQERAVASNIFISPQEIKDYKQQLTGKKFNNTEYHLLDILIALPEAPSPEKVAQTKQLANSILKEIQQGKNFQQLAIQHSSAQEALKGGDLGWRKLAQLPSVFADKVITMKKDEVVGPIQTPNGFHLIKLADIRTIGQASEQASQMSEAQIRDAIFRRKFEESLQKWITQLRASAYIKIMKS